MSPVVSSGISALDEVLQGLRPGANVVFQVDGLDDYEYFVRPFVSRSIADGRTCVYLRFAPHPPILEPQEGLSIIEVDPGAGFDSFSGAVHRIIEEHGKGVCYVFDNLSALVEEWATDELLANFFQITCPFLEVAREEAGQLPEVSYGTHFFQDLVEGHIIYLPVYPDDPRTEFNRPFFDLSRDVLTDLLPDALEFENLVRVIDVPAVADGALANVIADPRARKAVCFLA